MQVGKQLLAIREPVLNGVHLSLVDLLHNTRIELECAGEYADDDDGDEDDDDDDA